MEKARRLYEVARMANDALSPEVAAGLLVKAKQTLPDSEPDEKLSALIANEKAFADLMCISLWPQRKLEWLMLLTTEFEKSHSIICRSDLLECRFLLTRWKIGKYAKSLWINGESAVSSSDYDQILEAVRGLCDGNTSLDACIRVKERLQSYLDAFVFKPGFAVKEKKNEFVWSCSKCTGMAGFCGYGE
jgi:hypothetical protein